MKKSAVAILIGLLVSAAAPKGWGDEAKKAAILQKTTGSVTVTSASGKALARPKSRWLQVGDRLTLGQGASLVLRYLSDSHQEVVTGPCVVKISPSQATVISGPGMVRRADERGRVAELSTTANTEAAGVYVGSRNNAEAAQSYRIRGFKTVPLAEPVAQMQQLELAGSPEKAAALGKKALARSPSDPRLLLYLYKLYSRRLNDPAKALDIRLRAMAAGIDLTTPDWR